MTESGIRFVLYRHFTEAGPEYRWRLRSAAGETLAWSTVGYPEKSACEREMLLVAESYPGSTVRDVTLAV